MKIKHPVLAIFTVVCGTLLAATAFAAESVDISRKTSLTVNYLYNDSSPISNAEFSLYQIGTVDETEELILDTRFADYGIQLDLTDADDWATMAETVYGKLLVDEIAPAARGKTNLKGELVLSKLTAGLYLLAGAPITNEGYIYTAKPFFLTLPSVNSDNAWEYNVTVNPSVSRQTAPPEEVVSRRVMMVWQNDEGLSRPKQITVRLLCNGMVYDAQTLSADNNWSYEWDNLDASCEWSLVEENVPSNYTVDVKLEDTTFIVMNSYTPPNEQPGVLQSGQWWIAFLVGGICMLFIAAGVFLSARKGKRND